MNNKKPLCVISAPFATRSGYGEHSRDLIRSLAKLNKYDIKLISTKWGGCPMNALDEKDMDLITIMMTEESFNTQPDLWIQVTIPPEFQRVGKYNIGITAGIETTACAPSWLEACNKMDLILVPSQHSKDCLTRTNYDKIDNQTKKKIGVLKLERPIEVLFEGVDIDMYKKPKELSKTIITSMKEVEEDFAFLFVGHWLQGELGHDRKDVGKMIDIFCKTFKNKINNRPALILKTSGATFSKKDKAEITRKIESVKNRTENAPNVYLLHGDLTQEEMSSLYNHPKVKAHLTFTKGEGFGRPILEATLSGKPVIAPKWSGQVDFLNPEYSVLLHGKLQKVHRSVVWKEIIIPESSWYYVDYDMASRAMKDVFKNYSDYLKQSRKHIQYTKDNFSFDKMTDVFSELIEKYIPQFSVFKEADITGFPEMKKKDGGKIEFPKLKKV